MKKTQTTKIPARSDHASIIDKIGILEKALLEPDTRRCALFLDRILADEFKEYGKSGKLYRKKDILSTLPKEQDRPPVIKNLHVHCLEKNMYLATYATLENTISTARFSVWKVLDNNLRMVLHCSIPA